MLCFSFYVSTQVIDEVTVSPTPSLSPTETVSVTPSISRSVSSTVSSSSYVTPSVSPSLPAACEAFEIKGLRFSGNATVFGTTIGLPAYNTGSTSCNRGTTGTAWYKITTGLNSNVTISTCGDYTNFDTLLGVYTGTCNNLYCYEFNDDSNSCPSSPTTSEVSITSTEKNEYYISVSGYNSGTGGSYICIFIYRVSDMSRKLSTIGNKHNRIQPSLRGCYSCAWSIFHLDQY